jgi:arsenate reductase
LKPHDIIRSKEAVYLENYKGKDLTDAQWIQAMHENPILIERPIVINGNKAVVARPPEKVKEIL